MHDAVFDRFRLVLAPLAAAILLTGCQMIQPEAGTVPAPASEATAAPVEEAAADEIPVATFTITADGVTLPDEVMSGIVAVEFVNDGGPQTTPDIGRLVEGATVDQLMEALGRMETEGPGPALQLVKLYGHNNPAEGDRLIYDIQPGNHVVLVWPGDQGGGMPTVVEFTTGEASPAEPPTAAVQVQLDDFAFVMPDQISAGPQLWQIENVGEQWHEMVIVQLNEGVTAEDVLSMLMMEDGPQGEPPFQDFGGWLPISEGNRAWGTFDLPAGEYTVICFLPDIAGDMAPHAMKGMVRQLIVE